ncbi:MAG: HIT family protein [bacterium]|nr:HIT family protein [bacterium]
MCIFCKIINKEIPSYKVYEDEKMLAFLDIAPINSGHTLIVPKNHYVNLEAIPTEELSALMSTVKKVGALLKDKLGVSGYNITANNDPIAGQLIPHLHFHVIPRREGDGLKLWPGRKYEEGEAEEIIKKLKS